MTKLADLHGFLCEAERKRELLEQALEIQQECLEVPCNGIASALAKLGHTEGELGHTVQQCHFLKMSLTMYTN
eukprot:4103599-Amphidinium_carterae.1